MLATIISKGVAGRSPVHISLVEMADDAWSFPPPIPASTQDGQVTVGGRWHGLLLQ
jgi:hypothetical protein